MSLVVNGKPRDQGEREDFGLDRDPITGGEIDSPEQLPLEPKPKSEGHFTKRAKELKRRSGPKIRGGPDAD